MEKPTLIVVKIGGNIIDNPKKLQTFLQLFAALPQEKILVHGGGKLATALAEKLAIPQKMIDGRRITDAETLNIVNMVYAGHINKNIVASLYQCNCPAIGLSGADGNLIKASKRPLKNGIDYGFVGDIVSVQTDLLETLLGLKYAVIVAPITHNQAGQLLNTNADTIAQEIAKSLAKNYKVQLIYSFEKEGVLLDIEDENSVLSIINPESYAQLKKDQKIFAGMIPKLENAFEALEAGVDAVIIGKAERLPELINNQSGTKLKML